MHPSKTILAALVVALLALASTACAAAPQNEGLAPVPKALAKQPRLDIRWRAGVGAGKMWDTSPREYASPVYIPRTDELLTATSSGSLTKSRASNGEVVWQRRLSGSVHATPVVFGSTAYVATMDGVIEAFSLVDGTVLWSRQMRASIETRLAVADGRLFFTDSQDVLHAHDAVSGEPLWRFQRDAPDFFTIKGGGTPVVADNIVYCGFADGTLAALFADSGDIAWTADLSGGLRELVDVDLAPIVLSDRIYAASYAGGIYALDRHDGLILWRQSAESVADLTLNGSLLLVASAVGRVQAFDSNAGAPLWSFRMRENIPVDVSAAGPYAFVSTASGPLYVLDLFTGHALSHWDPSAGFNVPVVFGNDRGYLLSNGGYLYAFQIAY
ncbi:MAG: PQQ-binding-like beta-propeller repeat protein [Bradymonadaceae bacterium]|nr:PQQ-binding-like beta-propeller repeat protein [Lujinxingiaceae bacterium]